MLKFVVVDSAAAAACDAEETVIVDDCWYGLLGAALLTTGTINDSIPPPRWDVADAEDDVAGDGATKLP